MHNSSCVKVLGIYKSLMSAYTCTHTHTHVAETTVPFTRKTNLYGRKIQRASDGHEEVRTPLTTAL